MTRFLTRTQQAMIEDNMFRIATSTDPKMANAAVKAGEFYLRALDRDQYTERQVIEQTVTLNEQVQVINKVRDQIWAERDAKINEIRAKQAEFLQQGHRTIDSEPVGVRSNPPALPAPTPRHPTPRGLPTTSAPHSSRRSPATRTAWPS